MMRDIPHQATFQGFFFPFPPGGIWTRSFPVSTGDHPLWSRLLLGGGAAAAAIGTGDGGWGLPNANGRNPNGNQCDIFTIPTGA